MKIVHSPSPGRVKKQKANLFINDNPEELIRIITNRSEAQKIMLRLDERTQVLVDPTDATPKNIEKLRRKYGIGCSHKNKKSK